MRTSGGPDPRAPHRFGTFLRQLSLDLGLDLDRDLAAPVVVPGDRSGDLRS
ncbi:hypothetical protein [Streptomyces nigrescens]|uniref:hypothetical protein n=1 Tax=Streptomyces nigrescens TaxID=1920 RepID=UPI003472C141